MAYTGQDTYIVVGSGVFGASTALDLVRAGHCVYVLDRSADGYCAPDAASNDLNKIVRADYSDPNFRDLAKSAISVWRTSPIVSPYYHETGVVFHTGPATNNVSESKAYVDKAVASAHASAHLERPYAGRALKPAAHVVRTRDEVRNCFPSGVHAHLGDLVRDIDRGDGNTAYFNPRGGWAEANHATRAVLDEAKRLGAKVVGNAHVQSLLFSDGARSIVSGVRCADGRQFSTAGNGQVVLCVGGWAEKLLGSLVGDKLGQALIPTWSSAQCVLTLQLDEEQRKAFAGAPVVLEFSSGFYLFEPDQNGLMKMAVHSKGYRFPTPPEETSTPLAFPTFGAQKGNEPSSSSSSPQTLKASLPSHVIKQDYIPEDQTQRMLEHLRYVYPTLARAPIVFRRVCFYSESLDENWIIDRVPNMSNLIVASGDSGHAFKFLPILGQLVCARMGLTQAGTLTPHQMRVFSFDYHAKANEQQSSQSLRESSSFKARL